MLVDAYRAANVTVQVSDMRAAVERYNDDGSVDVLVAVRVKVTNSEAANQEQGYRLRVQMAPVDGTYKIAKLDQVTRDGCARRNVGRTGHRIGAGRCAGGVLAGRAPARSRWTYCWASV